MAKVNAKVLRRFTLNGTIDGHDPIGVTWKITGGDEPFRFTVITVNWGRGYDPGEFHRNVMNVLNKVGDEEHVALLVQELDEEDAVDEHRVFKRALEPKTTLVGWYTREPIAVSPGARVYRKRRRMTMDQGTRIGAPAGTGPRRFLVSCIAEIHGVKIGLANQHPHRNLDNARVQRARRRGEAVTRSVVAELVDLCDIVIHGGDMNDTDYPKSHPREHVAFERDLDTIRCIVVD